MDAATSRSVRERAVDRCEYCHLPERFSGLRFHVEHIVARQHHGTDDPTNLALACPECNLHKGTNLTGIDPASGQVTSLFHPRRDLWVEHFSRVGANVVGETAVGRATVSLLGMNDSDRLRLRRHLMQLGLLS
jgi:hypothetical protein